MLAQHAHPHGHHHVYVLEGTCRSDDEDLTPGSYVHVPANVPHSLGAGPQGCRLFYSFTTDDPHR